jgi:hypothetical protein
LDQISSSYYTHQEIPFFIIVAEFWNGDALCKRIFVIVSKHNRQDVHYVLESINFVLSLKIFDNIEKVFLVSDNASNLKNGFDLFNLFSIKGPLSGKNKRKKFQFVRINSWCVFCGWFSIITYLVLITERE